MAVITSLPRGNELVLRLATPLDKAAIPSCVVPEKKVTSPVAFVLVPLLTVAESVTASP